jgi:hypothetical protein
MRAVHTILLRYASNNRYWMMRQLERQLAERALCDPGVQVRVTRHIVQPLEHNTLSSSSVVHEPNAVSLKRTLCCGNVPYTLQLQLLV